MDKQTLSTENAPRAVGPYSQAVRCGNLIFVSGQIPINPATGVVLAEGVHKETRIIMDNIQAILEAAGSSMQKVIKFTVFLKKIDDAKFVNEVFEERDFGGLPARSLVECSNLPRNANVEIDAIAEA